MRSKRKDTHVVIVKRWNADNESYGFEPYAYAPSMKQANEIAKKAFSGLREGDLIVPIEMVYVHDIERKAKKVYVRHNEMTYEAPKLDMDRYLNWINYWENCKDADFMMQTAIIHHVDKRLTTMAGCQCVRQIGDDRMTPYLEIAEDWCAGKRPIDDTFKAYEELDEICKTDKSFTPAAYALWSTMNVYFYAAQGAVVFSYEILYKIGKFGSASLANEYLTNIIRKWIPLHVLLIAKIELDSKRE